MAAAGEARSAARQMGGQYHHMVERDRYGSAIGEQRLDAPEARLQIRHAGYIRFVSRETCHHRDEKPARAVAGACEKCWEMLGAAAPRGLRRAGL